MARLTAPNLTQVIIVFPQFVEALLVVTVMLCMQDSAVQIRPTGAWTVWDQPSIASPWSIFCDCKIISVWLQYRISGYVLISLLLGQV